MKLQARNLSVNMQGADVALLHTELRHLGLTIADAEATAQLFGVSTQVAVQLFQKQHGLAPTGVVDAQTATTIDSEAKKLVHLPAMAAGAVASSGPATLPAAARPNPPPTTRINRCWHFLTSWVCRKWRRRRLRGRRQNRATGRHSSDTTALGTSTVHGQVRHADGTVITGLSVQAFDQDLRCRETLGTALTDATGKYLIRYSAQQFQRAEKNSADLVVQVLDGAGKVLLSSPIMFNAPPDAVIDLTISGDEYRGPSEYEKLVAQIRPLLPGGISLADLVEDETHHDISFLAGETGEQSERIGFLAVANKFAVKTAVPPEVFYAFFRQGLPAELPVLLVQAPSVLRGALEASLKANLIPREFAAKVADILNALLQLIGQHVLRAGDGQPSATSLGGLLGTTGLSDKHQETFLQIYVQHEGPIEDFWKSLGQTELKDKVADLQLALQLGLLTQNNVPLVKALKGRDANLRSPRDLARISEHDWKDLIGGSDAIVSAIAPLGQSETREDKVTRYASGIIDVLRSTFPTAFVGAALDKDPQVDMTLVRRVLAKNPGLQPDEPLASDIDWDGLNLSEQVQAKTSLEALRQELNMFPGLKWNDGTSTNLQNPLRKDVVQFLSNSPELELRDDSIDRLIASDGDRAFAGVRDKEAVTDQLKRFQRVLRVAPQHDHMAALMTEGLDSARVISNFSEASFVDQLAPALGGADQARVYHKNARRRTDMVTSVTTNVHQSLNDTTLFVLDYPSSESVKTRPGSSDPLKVPPNFTTLFGSYSLCECGECRSVYSPAAYFVDVLHFLDPGPKSGKAQKKALKALLDRRPDLEFIPLTCENTNTEMPYVDLVNEILEFYVAHGQITQDAARDTVNITAEELGANPQYTIDEAYAALQTAVYPPTLPFHRPLEVARLYLEHLGSSRYQVMKTFQKKGVPTDTDCACEYLKISSAERQILTGDNQLPLWSFYGYASDAKIGNETWQANVARVPEFLRRTGTTYAELLQLLDSHFLNPNNLMALSEQGKDPQCDLDQTKINNLDDSILQKAHRFIRLAHKLEWAIPDVDETISAMQAADITTKFLEKLAIVIELKSGLNLALAPLLSLWADIETTGDDPLYAKLFLNKAVLNLLPSKAAPDGVDPDFEPDNTTSTGLQASTAKLADKSALTVIMAALSVGSDDLSAIALFAKLDNKLSLANLSQLYRFVVLARALKLKVADFLSLLALTGLEPFQAGEPGPTLDFVKKAGKVKTSGFSVGQLNYLFHPLLGSVNPLAPPEASVSRLTQVLQDGLRSIIAETMLEPDPTGEILRLKLAMVLDATLIDKAMAVIEAAGDLNDQNYVQASSAFIENNFKTFLVAKEAEKVLLDPSVQYPEARKQANRAYVSAHLMAYLRDSLSRGFIKQTLSGDLKLDAAVVELLLETVLKSKTDLAQYATADFLALMGDGLTAVYYDDPSLTNATSTRIDAAINFDWSNGGSPDLKTIPPGTYSAKWSGKVLPRYQEDYTFYLRTGGGVRLTIDGQTHIDDWTEPAGVTEYSGVWTMQPGVLHDIEVQFFKSSGQGIIELRWSSASTPKEIVPQTQLYSSTHFSLDLLMDSYRLLCKIALLINEFKINLKELSWLSNHPGDFSDFDFNALPMTAADFSPKFFDQWERLFDFFNFRDSLPQGDVGLTDVFGAASRDEAISQLKVATGWNNAEVDTLAGAVGFDLQLSDFSNEVNLLLMQDCLALSARLGVSCADLFAWAKDEPTPDRARDVVNAAKAKYEPERWLTVAKPLMDVLRGSQKAALIAYILASDTIASMGITDSNQLFEFFLIDVDMGTCMMTSRIKQAISSVQLFIQRCLMNLEPKVSPSQIDAGQWEWMKNYRVWEANRKVFLYPENWIEPELRDDKSTFFRELETQLLQNDVTKEAVEDAFLVYLKKLDEVAKLEVCGHYHQLEKEGLKQTDILHVFARTPNPPHVYYYRQLNAGAWTPWEKVNVDIEGDHLIPVIYNRRLYIFWPHFEEKPDKNQQLNAPCIQSAEHWRWVNDHANWAGAKQNHDAWETQKQKARDTVNISKNGIDSSKADWDGNDCDTLDQNPALVDKYPDLAALCYLPFGLRDLEKQLADMEKQEPLNPGSEPAEPAYSTPPSLTHWEIKLVWSEYTQGKWTAKQMSSEFVTSSLVQRSLEEAAKVVTKDLAGLGTNETITTIFLPEREAHFFRTTILDPESSDLMIDVYRRYEHAYNILDVGADRFSDFRHLGRFRLYCGAKVSAVDLSLSWEQPSPLPDHTINQFMAFQHQGNTENLTFTAGGKLQPILKTIPQTAGEYSLVPGHQYNSFSLKAPFQQFFYQDKEHAYYVAEKTEASKALLNADKAALSGKSGAYLKFDNFFHPFVCEFISTLSHKGISALLDLNTQKRQRDTIIMGMIAHTMFDSEYGPQGDIVDPDRPLRNVDFEHGAYALYNWELFFHIPMLIATSLSNNQQFEDAQAWFHYIFNPTTVSKEPVPQRYWNTLPFFNNNHPEKERIQQLLEALDSTDKATQALRDKVKQEIQEWRDSPFNPHLIARMRITAYQKNVVMKYIDNLIAWGDQLFSRDTIESINEATLLYVLAHSILGPKPEVIPSHAEIAPQTYSQLKTKLDDFSNALVAFENQLPYVASSAEVA